MTRAVRTVAAAFALSYAAATQAAQPWATPAGTSDTIGYADGQTNIGLFADTGPSISHDTFTFTPNNFYADNTGPATTDATSVRVTAKPGHTLTHFTASLGGDWSTLSVPYALYDGTPFTYAGVFAIGTLELTNPVTGEWVSTALTFPNQFDGEDGLFSQTVSLPKNWKSADVTLWARVGAMASPGSTAAVQIKTASIHVDTAAATPTAVPLPPALLAAIPGVIVAYAARRRMRA